MNKTINGYPFLFIHDSSKVIHIEAIVHSGFVHETKRTSGVNHLLEHILTDGWEKCKGSCVTYWNKQGGYMNASTDDTVMKYYVKGDKKNTPEIVDYIASIVTCSTFDQATLDREKKAVVEELTDLMDNPTQEIYNVFHKVFYKTEGIQYMEDCPLQIKNVRTLTMEDVKKAYGSFNPANCLFIVYGDYSPSIVSLFEEKLARHPVKKWPIEHCFSYKHDILFTKYDKESTTMYLGFPCSKKSFFIPYAELLIHHLLFYELRTKHQYIYDIDIECTPNNCGVVSKIEVNVQTKNAVKTFDCIVGTLQRYQSELVTEEYVEGIQKTMHYKYNTKQDFVDYYAVYEPLTKKQMIQKRKEFTAPLFRDLCRDLFPVDKALCVYQSRAKLPLKFPGRG